MASKYSAFRGQLREVQSIDDGVWPNFKGDTYVGFDVTMLTAGARGQRWVTLCMALLHAAAWISAIVVGFLHANNLADVEEATSQQRNFAWISAIIYACTLLAILVHSSVTLRGEVYEGVTGFAVLSLVVYSVSLSTSNVTHAASFHNKQYTMAMISSSCVSLGAGMAIAFFVFFSVNGPLQRTRDPQIVAAQTLVTNAPQNANREPGGTLIFTQQ